MNQLQPCTLDSACNRKYCRASLYYQSLGIYSILPEDNPYTSQFIVHAIDNALKKAETTNKTVAFSFALSLPSTTR